MHRFSPTTGSLNDPIPKIFPFIVFYSNMKLNRIVAFVDGFVKAEIATVSSKWVFFIYAE